MTKEEILEAINSTIVTNGQKGITAESLNNILVELANSGGSGAGGVTFYMGNVDTSSNPFTATQSETQKLHNAEMFQIIKNAEQIPPVYIDLSETYYAQMGVMGKFAEPSMLVGYIPAESASTLGVTDECVALESNIGSLMVKNDGSVEIMAAS